MDAIQLIAIILLSYLITIKSDPIRLRYIHGFPSIYLERAGLDPDCGPAPIAPITIVQNELPPPGPLPSPLPINEFAIPPPPFPQGAIKAEDCSDEITIPSALPLPQPEPILITDDCIQSAPLPIAPAVPLFPLPPPPPPAALPPPPPLKFETTFTVPSEDNDCIEQAPHLPLPPAPIPMELPPPPPLKIEPIYTAPIKTEDCIEPAGPTQTEFHPPSPPQSIALAPGAYPPHQFPTEEGPLPTIEANLRYPILVRTGISHPKLDLSSEYRMKRKETK